MNKPNVMKYFKMVKTFTKKHSPEILTGIGIAGMVTTTVLAVKATPKALRLIEEEKKLQNITALNTKVRDRLEELQCLLFEYEDLMIVLPESASSIYYEGKILNHCVGGYAERHANGVLSIVFLRTKNKPDIPYYTMEISTDNKIVQCRGFKNNRANNPKPQSVVDFEKAYQIYLNKFNKESKTA